MQNVYPLLSLGFSDTIADRLNDKLRALDTGCIQWMGASARGEGHIGVGVRGKGTTKPARVAWMLEHGPIPDTTQVRRQCRNTLCCRLNHLYLEHRGNGRTFEVRGHKLTSKELAQLREDGAHVTDIETLAYVYDISPAWAHALTDNLHHAA